MDEYKLWAFNHTQTHAYEGHGLDSTQLTIVRGFRITMIVLYAIVTCIAITNAYIYLYKQGMYKSFPLIATYSVSFILCACSISYQAFMMTCGE